ncbi:hypothetical protein AB0C69_28535 [Actinomadura sp. NPDC048032]|uniref:hypothetical protein n=1 Tax=Actinomadura sp. NPDC048032 TaxID=3155747 RepID=UPI0033C7143A
MFEEARKRGMPETWYGVGDGWDPSPTYRRIVMGDAKSLDMFREVNGFLPKLPVHDKPAAVLIVCYHPALLKGPHGSAIRRELTAIDKNGQRVGVYVEESDNARKR